MALDVMVGAELFTTDYNALSLTQRVTAVEQANSLGREAMEQDLAGDGVTIHDYYSPNDLWIRDAYCDTVASFTDLAYIEVLNIVGDDDPRVDAFVRGFRAEESWQRTSAPTEDDETTNA